MNRRPQMHDTGAGRWQLPVMGDEGDDGMNSFAEWPTAQCPADTSPRIVRFCILFGRFGFRPERILRMMPLLILNVADDHSLITRADCKSRITALPGKPFAGLQF